MLSFSLVEICCDSLPVSGICLVSFFQKPLVPAQARHAFSLVWRQERRNLGCRHWPMLEGFIVKGSSMMAVVAVMWLSWLFRYSLCFLSCFLLRPVWQSTFYARVGAGCKPSDFVSLCTCGLSDLTRKPRSLDLVGNRHTVIPFNWTWLLTMTTVERTCIGATSI